METSKEAKSINVVPNLLCTSDVLYPNFVFSPISGNDDLFAQRLCQLQPILYSFRFLAHFPDTLMLINQKELILSSRSVVRRRSGDFIRAKPGFARLLYIAHSQVPDNNDNNVDEDDAIIYHNNDAGDDHHDGNDRDHNLLMRFK